MNKISKNKMNKNNFLHNNNNNNKIIKKNKLIKLTCN